MTILFVGNTAADFFTDANSAGLYTTTDTDHRDTTVVPNDLAVNVSDGSSSPFTINLGAEYTDVWVHFRCLTPNIRNGAANGHWFDFYDGSSNVLGFADMDSDDFSIYATGDGSAKGVDVTSFPRNDNITFDFHIEVNGSTDITVSMYKDGSLVSTATNANTGGKGGLQIFSFTNDDITYTSDTAKYSEIIVTSGGESTLGWRLACLEPDGAGFHSDFEGDHVELSDDDLATAAGAGSSGDKVSSTVTYSGPTTTAGIRAVIAKSVATRGDSGPSTMKQFLRIGSTDYEGSAEGLSIDNTQYMEEWATNPNTSSPWQSSELNSLEVGVKAET